MAITTLRTVSDERKLQLTFEVTGAPAQQTENWQGPVSFQPQRLHIAWSGPADSPGSLTYVGLEGRRLNKDGTPNLRGIKESYAFVAAYPGSTKSRLPEATPDWIRNLVDQHRPTWAPEED